MSIFEYAPAPESRSIVDIRPRYGLFVDGEWTEAASGRRFDVVDPATEEVVATVADGGPEDAVRAIEAAGRAQKDWARTAPRERGEILRRSHDLIMSPPIRTASSENQRKNSAA